ncbi:hypothetical protein FA95DRAFT_1605178 [Auriscalpium vulgare]|uniref:Uncharacterized protein n=1 Tax=Auriscalpium vulgare TaxID=40419 RepID=A0ACB8RXQ6_9AGAM|nr:hypothetical protein FA95DRAFT_1605178 [Auriscalpium vulgare]
MRVSVAFVTLALSVASAPAFAAPIAAPVDDISILSRQDSAVSGALALRKVKISADNVFDGIGVALNGAKTIADIAQTAQQVSQAKQAAQQAEQAAQQAQKAQRRELESRRKGSGKGGFSVGTAIKGLGAAFDTAGTIAGIVQNQQQNNAAQQAEQAAEQATQAAQQAQGHQSQRRQDPDVSGALALRKVKISADNVFDGIGVALNGAKTIADIAQTAQQVSQAKQAAQQAEQAAQQAQKAQRREIESRKSSGIGGLNADTIWKALGSVPSVNREQQLERRELESRRKGSSKGGFNAGTAIKGLGAAFDTAGTIAGIVQNQQQNNAAQQAEQAAEQATQAAQQAQGHQSQRRQDPDVSGALALRKIKFSAGDVVDGINVALNGAKTVIGITQAAQQVHQAQQAAKQAQQAAQQTQAQNSQRRELESRRSHGNGGLNSGNGGFNVIKGLDTVAHHRELDSRKLSSEGGLNVNHFIKGVSFVPISDGEQQLDRMQAAQAAAQRRELKSRRKGSGKGGFNVGTVIKGVGAAFDTADTIAGIVQTQQQNNAAEQAEQAAQQATQAAQQAQGHQSQRRQEASGFDIGSILNGDQSRKREEIADTEWDME